MTHRSYDIDEVVREAVKEHGPQLDCNELRTIAGAIDDLAIYCGSLSAFLFDGADVDREPLDITNTLEFTAPAVDTIKLALDLYGTDKAQQGQADDVYSAEVLTGVIDKYTGQALQETDRERLETIERQIRQIAGDVSLMRRNWTRAAAR